MQNIRRPVSPTLDSPSGSTATPNPKILLVGGLIAWTLFVWTGRIRNVFLDDDLNGWSKLWRTSLAISFVALALVTAMLLVRAIRGSAGNGRESLMHQARQAAGILALYGIVVWAIRGTDILFGSHEVAFKVVHTVLAAVTITLGVLVLQRFVRTRSDLVSE